MAMHVPSLDAWDQFVWLPAVAMPWATMEVEQYGYHRGQAVDLGPIMPAMQFRVTDEAGTYLCVVRALVFEGSILAYNPARDEAEWVPTHAITNDLSWVKKSAMALANFVPCTSQEVAHIAGLGAHHLVSWPNNSSSEEDEQEEDEQQEDEQEEEEAEHTEAEGQGEAGPESPSGGMVLEQGETEQEAKPQRR